MVQDLTILVAQAQSGDEEAFDAIYEQFADPLYLYLVVRCDDQRFAEELTSALWMDVVEDLPAFRFRHPLSEEAFAAWLYRIAKNLLDDEHLRAAREQVGRTETLPSAEIRLDNQVIVPKAKQHLRAAVNQLTPGQRESCSIPFY